ncbi:SDR family NAD(P)-dependent oxidoreductase [Zhongshania marina]|uniref:SDR family NAD(P)-dependent oxidoreductase n=1 Tax=Zhongshania marina TaxID=2304603 RepID=A0ABX9W5Q7_9GAMM|nr:SDR family NAD(P)-dependent oxidoreductase [Zhongshania marina]
MTTVKNTFGSIDVLVNAAGSFTWEKFNDGEFSSWDRMFRLNLLSAVSMSEAALGVIKQSRLALPETTSSSWIKPNATADVIAFLSSDAHDQYLGR